MTCPRCGNATPGHASRCPHCGAGLTQTSVATGVAIGIDTTGLPPGATFGPAEGATLGGTDAGMTVAVDAVGAATAPGGPLRVGPFGSRYHILKLLGLGGMGAVYQAWDAQLGVAVALKVIRVDARKRSRLPEAERRLIHEINLARQVTHKNVVRIHDLGDIDGIKFITMPFVQGEDLSTLLRRELKLPVKRALRLARQIAAGMVAAHEAGVVHRDLKPANIMISGKDADESALIMDFGISASAEEDTSGAIIGTLEYMAPEQAAGKAVDARADVYAFGLIVYECLLGLRLAAPLLTPAARVEAMKYRVAEGVVPLRTVDGTIAEALEAIVMRCVEADPAKRYQSAAELVAALNEIDDNGRRLPMVRRLTKPMMVTAGVVVGLLLAGTYYTAKWLSAPPVQHPPITVLLADADNQTGDPLLNGTLEPAMATALEEASFVSAYRIGAAHALAAQLSPGSKRMDEALARLVAVREGVNVVIATTVSRDGGGYRLSARAIDAATGKQLASRDLAAGSRDSILPSVGRLTAPIRQALGDTTPRSKQLAAAETFTAGSLEAAHEYSVGQELQQSNPIEAIKHYRSAIELDPKLGRAYAGLAVSSIMLKQRDEAEGYYKTALSLLDHMSDREKLRTLGNYYGSLVHNYDKAIETFETLVSRYPGDDAAYNNLSVGYAFKLQFGKAVVAIKRARDLNPASIRYQFNYVADLMDAGDFATAVSEGQRIVREHPEFPRTYLPLALSLEARGDVQAARDVYARLEQLNPSVAAIGQADLEMYLGREKAALKILESGIARDERDKNTGELALKHVAMAEAQVALGQKTAALQAARRAAQLSSDESVQYPAARVLLAAGDEPGAERIAAALDATLQTQNRSYAKLIAAEIAFAHKRYAEALDAAVAAQKLRDSWIANFLLGRIYVESGHFAEAIGSFDVCEKRKGETPDFMFINSATLRYLPPLYYWLARAQAGVGSAAAPDNYRKFLALRADSDAPDPLVADSRRALTP